MPADTWDTRIARISHLLDDGRLSGVLKQPGVIAVLAFYEGFPVKSVGNGDFEQVAAIAEDFLRAGEKISRHMNMGAFRQLILEADDRKCVIVPWGDLSLCLIARSDANLGLIRVAIRNLQAIEERG